jgi:hypothetical protein
MRFAAYFHPGLLIDHVVAEAWDEDAGDGAGPGDVGVANRGAGDVDLDAIMDWCQ